MERYKKFSFKYYSKETMNGSQIPFNFDYITKLNNQSNVKNTVKIGNRWLTHFPNKLYLS